ncbi:hypothetical protein SADUNF_Sadunf17G0034100 [Salix dunnii]|uniref:Uncharacterized protein n=1 Tax=Salix dunnii TaxID=1413687 RepID=A0A835J5A7_9ROSI|nr:hypothetical protein SADUNF_Sadunf17G0034100 [Salix dunnii]
MGSGALVLEFRKSSYGIATLTAGSLDFQDVIPRPRLRGGAGICTSLFDHGCFSTVIANRRHGVKRGVVRRAKGERGQKEGSDGIRCISAGMIAPISTCRMKCYKQSSMIPQQRGEAARRCIFTGVSEE